jgi:hypothetical protein
MILVDIEQCDYDLSVYAKKYKVCLEELDTFANIVKDIVPNLEKLESYKEHNVEEERQYWITRMAKQATMDLMTIGRIGSGNLDSIAMMPLKDQEETIKAALKYNSMFSKGIHLLEKKAQEELALNAKSIDYIENIVDNQQKIESKIKGEDI